MSSEIQTERMKKLAEICWVMGLSYRKTEQILCAFGVMLNFMSVRRSNPSLSLRRETHAGAPRLRPGR